MKFGIYAGLLILTSIFAGCEDTAMLPAPLPSTQAATSETATSTSQPSATSPSNITQANTTSISNTVTTQPAPVTPTINQPVTTPAVFTPQKEGQTAHNLEKPLSTIKQYLAYVPEGYNAKTGEKWPVVVFLHGNSDIGTDINAIFWTYFAWRTMDRKSPYILITPQLLTGNSSWSASDLDKMLDEVFPKYNADASRIILTGYSLGAHGAWDWAELNANRFAALVPISGWGDKTKASSLKNLPVWAFHGDADNVVSVNGTLDMINAIKSSGGDRAKVTIYPGRGHDVHSTTYDNPDVISWMLTQKK